MTARVAAGTVALACLWAAPGSAAAPPVVSDGRPAMGTVLEITLADARDAGAARRTLARCFAQVARLDALLTRHAPDSALARLNRRAGRGPQRVAPELARIVAESIAWSRATRGSFDPSVGPLVRVWERAARANRLPDPDVLGAARARVGARHLDARPPDRVEILDPGSQIDLGGIAKGWALDRLVERVRARGHASALLDFGQSSLHALGAPPDAPGWRVLLRDPAGGFAGVVTLRDRALSVSGSFGQVSEIEGRRFGHVLDPRSGWPLERAAQAAVVAPGGAQAEALSKALLVLGAEEGIALLEALPDTEGLLLEAGGVRRATAGWAAATRFAGSELVAARD